MSIFPKKVRIGHIYLDNLGVSSRFTLLAENGSVRSTGKIKDDLSEGKSSESALKDEDS